MFNNVLYFIVVLLLFNISSPGSRPEAPAYSLAMLFLTWLVLAFYGRWGFRRLLARWQRGGAPEGVLTGEYHALTLRLSIFSILLFALDIHLFHLRYWLRAIPGLKTFSVLEGAFALALFMIYLATIWYHAYPSYRAIFRADMTRRGFVASHVKFNIPVLFPWLTIALAFDLVSLIPSRRVDHLLNSPEGQILFFALFLCLLTVFMPPLVQTWWGCRPFPESSKLRELEDFLRQKSFGYRRLLRWPLLEGRILTAGIMGVVPRFRYILVTDGLMEVLTAEEMKAVLAHEMGHAKHRHMLFYLLFLLVYMVISYGLFDLFTTLLSLQPFFTKAPAGGEPDSTLFYLALSLPVLVTMIVYFRFVMGFFMRHFERQADLYSAATMGTPRDTISSLEKIAYLGGKIRDLPSWHHFSIRQRVETLLRSISDPFLHRKQSRFIRLSLACYILGMAGLVYLLLFSPVKENVTLAMAGKVLRQQAAEQPGNIALYESLAMVYHRMGRLQEAMGVYEKMLRIDPRSALAANNLAWLLLTVPSESLRDKARALELAKRAVSMSRSPSFLDTLAEAYYANGLTQEAVATMQEAISVISANEGHTGGTEGVDYYRKQLKRFAGSAGDRRPEVGTMKEKG